MGNRLESNYQSLKLKNPLLAASAGTTKDVEHAKRAEDAGFAAVVLKSIQEEVVHRYNPFPRFAYIRNGIPGFSADTFYSYEQAYEYGIEEYANEIRRVKEAINIPTIASINCVSIENWVSYSKCAAEAGADALELVPSCPIGMFLREGIDLDSIAVDVLKQVKNAVKIPVSIKLSLQLSNPARTALKLQEAGADGVIMFNRMTGIDIDIEQQRPILHGGVAGHGGPWVIQSNLRWLIEAAKHLTIPVSASGGVTRWEDVIKYLLAGASTVQIGTLIYLKGFQVVQEILQGIENYLEKENVSSLAALRGRAVQNFLSLDAADRSKKYVARVNDSECTHCRRCAPVCIYGALSFKGEVPEIDPALCDGCGLCSQVCPKRNVIVMNPRV